MLYDIQQGIIEDINNIKRLEHKIDRIIINAQFEKDYNYTLRLNKLLQQIGVIMDRIIFDYMHTDRAEWDYFVRSQSLGYDWESRHMEVFKKFHNTELQEADRRSVVIESA